MDFLHRFDKAMVNIESSGYASTPSCQRLRHEVHFARLFAELFDQTKDEWNALILDAVEGFASTIADGRDFNIEEAVSKAESIMTPIGRAAKEYTIHCCGHAHIDMDWMWPFPETVSICHDTFSTVDKLMDEFPDFKFTQSQISVYEAMEKYSPEIFERIRQRIAEGRWEPAASQWVEGDKNMASGEILCRHLLYSKRYLNEKFGIPYDQVKIDWEPDTFGHAWSIPSILVRGGVTRYGYGRMAPDKWLFWWKAPDGSKVLSFFYNKLPGFGVDLPIDYLSSALVDFVKENGLKDFLTFYGVGDHGGGPTRQMIMKALEANTWPIFPNYKLATMDEYYSKVEAQDLSHLYVLDDEINFVFDGCWTSQTGIKHANRVSENVIPEVEALSIIVSRLFDAEYPSDNINEAWRLAMFNQFHDILPGSGIHATYIRAEGEFQEVQSITDMIRTRALKQIAQNVNTSGIFGIEPPRKGDGAGLGPGVGGGAGDLGMLGGISAWGAGSVEGDPFLVYNQMPYTRSGIVAARIWNREIPHNMISVRGPDGTSVAAQVIETGNYWLYHNYITVLFPANTVPGMGYRTYIVERDPAPAKQSGVSFTSPSVMENEHLKVEFDLKSGGILHLVDKATGYDFVPNGEIMGVLEYCHEAANPMSSWTIGPIMSVTKLIDEGKKIDRWQGIDLPCEGGLPFSFARTENPFPPTEYPQNGPYRCALRFGRDVKSSRIWVEVGLDAGSRMIDYRVIADWHEIGTPSLGVPMLRIAFPISISDTKATYEIPFATIERNPDGREVPSLRWADLSGAKINAEGQCGITLVNADKYGHNADANVLRLTLIRSSFNPDPVPEVKRHDIRFGIAIHDGMCNVSDAVKEGASFNLPMSVLSTDIHTGDLPGEMGFVEELTPNVKVSALKKAEDSDAIIVRLYETSGIGTEGAVRLSNLSVLNASVQEVDVIETPIGTSAARMDGDVLRVTLPAHGIMTVKIELGDKSL